MFPFQPDQVIRQDSVNNRGWIPTDCQQQISNRFGDANRFLQDFPQVSKELPLGKKRHQSCKESLGSQQETTEFLLPIKYMCVFLYHFPKPIQWIKLIFEDLTKSTSRDLRTCFVNRSHKRKIVWSFRSKLFHPKTFLFSLKCRTLDKGPQGSP